jgi:hypothetical protein
MSQWKQRYIKGLDVTTTHLIALVNKKSIKTYTLCCSKGAKLNQQVLETKQQTQQMNLNSSSYYDPTQKPSF